MQPSVLIVLTNKDKVSKQYISNYKRKIRRHIRGKATGKLVLPDIFAVDNTDENPLSVHAVREYIRKVARGLPLMGERIPNTWLHLRSKLTTKIKKGDAVWKFKDVARLARDPDINITDRSTLSRVLTFLHDRGDIIFLRDSTLGGDVTLQPPLVALEFQEVCPKMTKDKRWYVHLPREGKYRCKRTDLGVVTSYPLNVTYKIANWSEYSWPQGAREWMPVGPLFSIQCEDVKVSVDILLPHVLHLAEGSEITREDLRVIHVVGDFQELLLVTELTNSHAVTRFKKGSDWGLVGRTEKVSNVVRSGLLMSFRSLEDSDLSLLKVYIVSNCRAVKEFLTFEDTLDTDRFYAPFRVEVSQNLWRDTTARLHLQLLEEIDDHTKESVSELILVNMDGYFETVVNNVNYRWADLARKLGFTRGEVKAIENDNLRYPGPKEKCWEMLGVWENRTKSQDPLQDLKQALIDIGQRRTAKSLGELSN
uniref:Death domain-containing protein n=1 Tax=Branchiostoma floridae TaxID=7739 RepID=C3ZSU0_BRAFL|eukprot:XP_002588481.1 hypothetical protein BRAFLDRAFT_117008 [Branchiostoma floridae]